MPIEQSRDPERFGAFELSGWNSNIAGYETAFGPVARQTVPSMLDAAEIRSGMDVLDVCCGPGALTAAVVERGGRAVGLDFSPAAISLAQTLVPQARFQQGDAQSLPFPAASFDAVLCGYGLMHVPQPEMALREMLRVLRPGGRAAFSAWDESGVAFPLVYEAVRACGTMDVPLPQGPGFFQFGTRARMLEAMTEAGFGRVNAVSVDQDWHVGGVDQYLEAILKGTVRARAVLAAQTKDAAAGVRAYIADYLNRFRTPAGALAIPMPAVVGSGGHPK